MKKYKHLFDNIVKSDNFRKAFTNAIKGKRHYTEVRKIFPHRHHFINSLRQSVIKGTYQVSEYYEFQLYTGGKLRDVAKLPMKDRIVQHAIMIYLEPIFRETFIEDTFSSIKGRGIHRGLSRVKTAVRDDNYKYVLQLDIHHCYQSLDHDILKAKLAQKFIDKRLLNLLYVIIDSYEQGVPIGNYTSQYFNNFYFNDFDHWIKEVKHIKHYFRYCDDIVIFGKTKEELHELLKEIKVKLNELKVQLKPNYRIYPKSNGVNFLGYITYKDHIEIRKRTKLAFIEKCSKMDFDNLTDKDVNVLGSYWGLLKYGDCRNLWFKYTGVKTFKELNISIKKRDFVKDIVDTEIIVNDYHFCWRKKERWLKFDITYFKEGDIEVNSVVPTQGELLMEAAEQFRHNELPFSTVIKLNDKGYYEFT